MKVLVEVRQNGDALAVTDVVKAIGDPRFYRLTYPGAIASGYTHYSEGRLYITRKGLRAALADCKERGWYRMAYRIAKFIGGLSDEQA